MKSLEQVIKFNITSGVQPDFNNKQLQKLRIDLIKEELSELETALNNNDKVETLDALGDLLYVVLGAAHCLSFENVFEKAFDKIHESNMSKFCDTYEEAIDTFNYYSEKNIDVRIEDVNNKFIIKRESDGKTLKNVNYQPVNLTDLV